MVIWSICLWHLHLAMMITTTDITERIYGILDYRNTYNWKMVVTIADII